MDKGWVRRHYLAVREIQRNVEKNRGKERKGEKKEKKMSRVNHYQSAFNSQFSIPW